MLSNKSNKELVEAGHQFAKALDADMPLTEIAKLVSALSTRLDCAIVRGDELQQKLDALAAENDLARKAVQTFCDVVGANTDAICEEVGTEGVKAILAAMSATGNMPVTDVYLNSVRAESWADALVMFKSAILADSLDHIDFLVNGKIEQLRSGTHDTADKAEDIKPDSLTALPVERDQYGYWSHPDYLAFCDGREYIPSAEFNQWMEAKGLEWKVDYHDEEEIEPNVDGYDLCTWNPEAPEGDGWFIGSIHDTDDGAVCIWLRVKAGV